MPEGYSGWAQRSIPRTGIIADIASAPLDAIQHTTRVFRGRGSRGERLGVGAGLLSLGLIAGGVGVYVKQDAVTQSQVCTETAACDKLLPLLTNDELVPEPTAAQLLDTKRKVITNIGSYSILPREAFGLLPKDQQTITGEYKRCLVKVGKGKECPEAQTVADIVVPVKFTPGIGYPPDLAKKVPPDQMSARRFQHGLAAKTPGQPDNKAVCEDDNSRLVEAAKRSAWRLAGGNEQMTKLILGAENPYGNEEVNDSKPRILVGSLDNKGIPVAPSAAKLHRYNIMLCGLKE
jgi:hypothetical protein